MRIPPAPVQPLASRRRRSAARRPACAALVLALTGGAVGLGCGASDEATGSSSPAPSRPDASMTPGPDAGSPSSDSGGFEPGPARMVAVNASPDLFELRVCFAVTGDSGGATFLPVSPAPSDPSRPMPRTNYPGVAPGNGADVDGVEALVGAGVVTPYVVNARQLSVRADWRDKSCAWLFSQPSQDFVKNVDYIPLAPLDSAALAPGRTTVLVVSGCRPIALSSAASAARCGDDYDDARGNVRGSTLVVRDAPASAPTLAMNAQFVQLAPALGATARVHAAVAPLTADGLDASSTADSGGDAQSPPYPTVPLGAGQRYLEPPTSVTPIPFLGAADASDLSPFFTTGLSVTRDPVEDGGDGSVRVALVMDFEAIARISSPTSLPSTYFANGNYLFALVGDPTDPAKQLKLTDGGANAAFDGTGLHVVAIPVTRPDDAGRSAL